jgi:folate-binding protein YgfZ
MDWLRDEWLTRGLGLGHSPEEGVHAGPSPAEIAALDEGALLVPLPDCGRLRLTGADRIDFLHGQISNDVRGMRPGTTNRSLLLNHKGHALAELRVLRFDERLEALVEDGLVETVERSLRQHIIFDQVELARPRDSLLLTVQGPGVGDVLDRALSRDQASELPAAGDFTATAVGGRSLVVWRSSRSRAGGVDLLLEDAAAKQVVESILAAGAVPGSRSALDWARVAGGFATAAHEAGEGILPQEAGLEELVSYRKGCYLGQEIMARIEARGKLRRGLGALKLDREPVGGQREVVLDGKTVGRLGTTVRHPEHGLVALAVLRTDLPPEAVLEVGEAPARQVPLPPQ